MSSSYIYASSDDNNDDVDELIDTASYRRRRQRADTAPRTRLSSRRTTAIAVAVLIALVLVAVVVGLVVARKKRKAEDDGAKNRCKSVQNVERFDCHPDASPTQRECLKRGCCWRESRDGSPACFYADGPSQADRQYSVAASGFKPRPSDDGLNGYVEWDGGDAFPHTGLVEKLSVDVEYQTATRLRIRIADADRTRYEVPLDTPPPVGSATPSTTGKRDYAFSYATSPFGFAVTRISTGETLFNTTAGRFFFADQFVQMSARLASAYVYGLGEHVQDVGDDETDVSQRVNGKNAWRNVTLFSRDIFPENSAWNLYGVHPFFLGADSFKQFYGVFLKNSNAMDIQLQPLPAITYRTIGGILDFYIFMGPTPENVIQQYTEIIGRPFLPPYWALGFHLCRWGYNSSKTTWDVVKRMRRFGVPHDVQWNDIDYMHAHLDFTYNHTTFGSLPQMVDDLHAHDQKYIMIVDPGISNEQPRGSYAPYDRGVEMGVFINVSATERSPILGKVWPDVTAFPDFTNPSAFVYWKEMIETFRKNVSFDGLWIDMNEPANFVSGSVNGCPSSSLNDPPYQPGERLYRGKLYDKTLCMSAQQSASLHYNVHSLYGHTEAKVTSTALESILKKRSLVISRSTYAGTGRHAGHWLGDNQSQWPDIVRSVPGILDFSLFGIPLVGADICGFGAETNAELCTRWMQLGAFYPFSRNHNSIHMKSQEPTAFDNATLTSMRRALLRRYRLLPYLYTLFYRAHVDGSTVARPLFFEFPQVEFYDVGNVFMWGGGLLIVPVLKKNAASVTTTFPDADWFDFETGESFVRYTGKGVRQRTIPVDLTSIPLYVRGGFVIPTQAPNTTTAASRKNPFTFVVALDTQQGRADGELYLDDGESLGTVQKGDYSLFHYTAFDGVKTGNFTVRSVHNGFHSLPYVETVVIHGLKQAPKRILVNSVNADVNFAKSSLNVDVSNARQTVATVNVHWFYN